MPLDAWNIPRQERREFFRLNFSTPLRYKSYAVTAEGEIEDQTSLTKGASQNISQSGILFQTKTDPPKLSSIVWMNLDFRTLSICKEIEKRALVFENGLLGKVVRIEEDAENERVYDVGVCFLTKDQKDAREVQSILSEISQGTSQTTS